MKENRMDRVKVEMTREDATNLFVTLTKNSPTPLDLGYRYDLVSNLASVMTEESKKVIKENFPKERLDIMSEWKIEL